MSEQEQRQAKRRDEQFAQRIATRIWHEEPCADNPYLAAVSRCHGYELTELMRGCSYPQVLYLLLRGELPAPHEAQLLERLMIGLINPGPRHPATRAAMTAGVGKTDPAHLLPISLLVLGGAHLGGGEIEPCMRFLRKSAARAPSDVAQEVIALLDEDSDDPDRHPCPGFGRRFGAIDPMPAQLARELAALADAGSMLAWGEAFAAQLREHRAGWLSTGVAAAVFCDLGFMPRAGAGLFQLLGAPGLLAHGIEFSNKPVTAFPWVSDENYVIENG